MSSLNVADSVSWGDAAVDAVAALVHLALLLEFPQSLPERPNRPDPCILLGHPGSGRALACPVPPSASFRLLRRYVVLPCPRDAIDGKFGYRARSNRRSYIRPCDRILEIFDLVRVHPDAVNSALKQFCRHSPLIPKIHSNHSCSAP